MRFPLWRELVLAFYLAAAPAALAHEERLPNPFAFNESAANYNDRFIIAHEPVIALTHVRVIDGTGAPARANQTILIENGRIARWGANGRVRIPSRARIISLEGRTVMPGWVMHHEHLYVHTPSSIPAIPYLTSPSLVSYPRLMLASGITTARTAGSYHPLMDLDLKHGMERGGIFLGPDFDFTAPHLQGELDYYQLMRELSGPEDADRSVRFWSSQGFTSFKVYSHITHEELSAAIHAAHDVGARITGHICSISYSEAAEAGIDQIEHGFANIYVDLMDQGLRHEGQCPYADIFRGTPSIDVNAAQVQSVFRTLIQHNVVIDSTPAGLMRLMNTHILPDLPEDVLASFSPQRREMFTQEMAARAQQPDMSAFMRKVVELDVAFWRAGGTLVLGSDAVSLYGALPGQTNLESAELLQQGGIPAVEVIKIGTHNGAEALGMLDDRGTITAGKRADLVVVQGDPTTTFHDIFNVEYVFQNGIGYNPAALRDSVRGTIGSFQ